MAQRWFIVTPEAIYELASSSRVLRSWPEDGLFEQLILSGYPATLWPEHVPGITRLPEPGDQTSFVDLAVETAPFTITTRTLGPGALDVPMPEHATAVFEHWYRLQGLSSRS